MNEEIDPQDEIKIAGLLRDLKLMRERRCSGCDGAICGHEALMSLTMGFKDAPRCWHCLAAAMEQVKDDLRDRLFAYIALRPCHHAGWVWANREEGFEPAVFPTCLWPLLSADGGNQGHKLAHTVLMERPISDPGPINDAEWDAGDIGCGDLVLQLRIRLRSIQPGQMLKVTAKDPGAPEDLPAWCRMTGHALIASHHPMYLIKRKEN